MTITMPELDEITSKLNAKRDDLAAIFAEAGPTIDLTLVKSLNGDNVAKAAEIKQLHDEINDLATKADELKSLRDIADAVDGYDERDDRAQSGDDRKGSDSKHKSFTELFMESDAYKHKGASSELALKTLMSTTAGFAPDQPRGPIVVPIALRAVELVDLIPKIQTNSPAVVWMEQTTRTNAAAETSEGSGKPEAVIVYTERTSLVQKIAVTLPVTDEQLDDVPQIRSILETDLELMVRQRLSDEIASGDGTPPNLRGILSTSGIQTQAKGADPVPDAVYKAMVKVMTTGQATPDAYVTNPLDWQDVRLLRTTDGIYIWGNPSDAGPERIWGLNVILAQGMTLNTGVVGAWQAYSRLAIKQDVTVDIGLVNDDFSKNRQTLRAEMRAALLFLRPTAFCSVTGI